jgi:SpoVK/Ycf46/Vps4 family AAA+-type ATPase
MADFEEECRHFKPAMLRGEDSFVDVRPVAWADIGGLDDVKLQIQQVSGFCVTVDKC